MKTGLLFTFGGLIISIGFYAYLAIQAKRTKTQYYKDHPEELIIDAEYTVISSD